GSADAALQVTLTKQHSRVDRVPELSERAEVLVGVDHGFRVDELLDSFAVHSQATRAWTARPRKLLSRIRSSTGSVKDGGIWPCSSASSSITAARRPISPAGCATVVRRGFPRVANGISSNPTTATSSGTRRLTSRSAP